MSYFVGLDLGHSADYTALAVVEQIEEQLPTGRMEKRLRVKHLECYPLRTSSLCGLASWGNMVTMTSFSLTPVSSSVNIKDFR
jgi:hypothetical protein